MSLDSLADIRDVEPYRRIFVRGHYDMEHQLLLDNRTYEGYAGYHVLTPLRLADSDKTVLVNRGWVPVGNNRAVLPDIPGTSGELLVDATIQLPPEKLFRLGAMDEENKGWPQVVQQIEMKEFEQRLGYPLQPLILLLDKDDEFGFIRDWKPVYGVTPDKHRAYAVQWFTLAAVLLMIYIGREYANAYQQRNDADTMRQNPSTARQRGFLSSRQALVLLASAVHDAGIRCLGDASPVRAGLAPGRDHQHGHAGASCAAADACRRN